MLKLTPAESDLLRPWLISRMRTGGQAMNDKALAEELDFRTAAWGERFGGSYKGTVSRPLSHRDLRGRARQASGPGRAVINEADQLQLVPGDGQVSLLFDAPEGAGPQ